MSAEYTLLLPPVAGNPILVGTLLLLVLLLILLLPILILLLAAAVLVLVLVLLMVVADALCVELKLLAVDSSDDAYNGSIFILLVVPIVVLVG